MTTLSPRHVSKFLMVRHLCEYGHEAAEHSGYETIRRTQILDFDFPGYRCPLKLVAGFPAVARTPRRQGAHVTR